MGFSAMDHDTPFAMASERTVLSELTTLSPRPSKMSGQDTCIPILCQRCKLALYKHRCHQPPRNLPLTAASSCASGNGRAYRVCLVTGSDEADRLCRSGWAHS